jgi:para-aminobenzoate synthetase component 1
MLPLCEEFDSVLSPAEIFPAFMDEPCCLFLDSGMSHERLGRSSYITADPLAILRAKGNRFEHQEASGCRLGSGDPFLELQRQLRQRSLPALPDLPPFQGGWAGYFGYELGRHLERLPATVEDDVGLPDMYVCLYDWVIAHDHLKGRTWLFADGGPEGDLNFARERLAWIRAKAEGLPRAGVTFRLPTWHLASAAVPTGRGHCSSIRTTTQPRETVLDSEEEVSHGDSLIPSNLPLHGNFTRGKYLRAVEKVKEYIAKGDTYEVNLSQRFDAPLKGDPWRLYSLLRQINPAPFAAFIKYPELTVLSASPEQFLKLENGHVETRPIKGTRPRGATPEMDSQLARELIESEKERAENVMIVDLLRNDLGRVCKIGSVAVPELFVIEEYSTVHHLVSTVVGELEKGLDAVDVLRACFPGGSITGAPKIRSMEIIDELEPTERGIYCGSIGYLGHDGNMNTSIVIRTMVVCDDRVYFQVGGAIVADSQPADEYDETLHKARALMMALQKAGEQ